MSVRLLVKNIANKHMTGDVIAVCVGSHVFGRYESKAQFVDSGLHADDWPREFVIVNVPDANQEDYQHLLEDNSNDERRYYIAKQESDSPFYQELLGHAEITVSKAILDSTIIDRGA